MMGFISKSITSAFKTCKDDIIWFLSLPNISFVGVYEILIASLKRARLFLHSPARPWLGDGGLNFIELCYSQKYKGSRD